MIAFLGSFRFALVLIALSALGVIAGTVLESRTDSHGVAEDWIYGNPLFQALLGGYFINIFLSTLSRRPFKRRHIPFIITHIGLLMIISGVFIKSFAGTQGHMQLIEGSFTDDLILPNVRALAVRSRDKTISIPEKELTIKAFFPHAEELVYGWNKDEKIPLEAAGSYIAYDQGFHGYAMQVEVPFISPKELKEELSNHSGPFSPPLELIRHSTDAFVDYLIAWDEEGTFLSDLPFPVNWETVPQNIQNALFWIAELFEEEHFMETLRKNKWPLMEALENEKEAPIKLWMAQMWELKDDLPKAPYPTSKMLPVYLRLYDIHLSKLPFKTITMEAPLHRSVTPKDPPLKKEDAEPLALIEFEGETYPLVYDTKGSRLKTPAKGEFLLNYQPHRVKLPFTVRLHSARDIKYPDSDQTASYECTLTVGNSTPCHLQMNQVHETPDGYRFYLAGMGQIDPYGVRTVQLVVNLDPAKWILTYPGALLLSLGIILLFWKHKLLSFFN